MAFPPPELTSTGHRGPGAFQPISVTSRSSSELLITCKLLFDWRSWGFGQLVSNWLIFSLLCGDTLGLHMSVTLPPHPPPTSLLSTLNSSNFRGAAPDRGRALCPFELRCLYPPHWHWIIYSAVNWLSCFCCVDNELFVTFFSLHKSSVDLISQWRGRPAPERKAILVHWLQTDKTHWSAE